MTKDEATKQKWIIGREREELDCGALLVVRLAGFFLRETPAGPESHARHHAAVTRGENARPTGQRVGRHGARAAARLRHRAAATTG